MEQKKDHLPLTIIFPNLHYDRNWDISDGSSLWSIFILNNITETLLRVGNNSDLTPAIASGWVFSEDKKKLTLSLSNQYRFHNGKTIKPQDVLASLKRSISSSQKKHSKLYDFLFSTDLNKSLILNNNEIEIKLKSNLNALAYKLSIPEMGIAPSDYAKNQTPKESLDNLSGPYKVLHFTPKELKLERHSGHPLLDERSPGQVNIIEIPDINKSIEYYKSHDNVTLVGSGYVNASKYIDLEGEKNISSFAFTEFLVPNIESKNLDNKEKRKPAFSVIKKAFDEISIDQRIAERTHQVFTKNNLARLKESELSTLYENYFNKIPKKLSILLFKYVQDSPIPSLLRKELKKFGIELEIIAPNDTEAYDLFQKKEYDFLYLYSGVTALDPIVELIYLFNHRITNLAYKNKPLLDILEEAKTETNRDKYISLLKDVHLGLLKEYRILPLMHTRMVYASKGIYKLKELSYFDGGLNLWDWHRK